MRSKFAICLIVLILVSVLSAENTQKAEEGKAIEDWLMLGPAPVTGLERAAYDSNRDIANHRFLDFSDLWPKSGQ